MSEHFLDCAARTKLEASKKLVFMALCNDADDLTRVALPGVDDLYAWSGLGKSRLYDAIAELIGEGYLLRLSAGRKGHRAEFRVFDRIACCSLHDPADTSAIGSGPADPKKTEKGSGVADPIAKGSGPADPMEANGSGTPDPEPAIGSGKGSGSYRTPSISKEQLRTEVPVTSTSAKAADADTEPVRLDVERLCQHLADRIVDNGAAHRPNITKRWRDAARLLLDRDGRTEANIHLAIDWCQNDEFWRSNVLSMPKLREKYEQLRLRALEQQQRAQAGITRPGRPAPGNPYLNDLRDKHPAAAYITGAVAHELENR